MAIEQSSSPFPADYQFQPQPPVHSLAITPELKFEEAAARWLESRLVHPHDTAKPRSRWAARYIKPATEAGYRQILRSVTLFFGGKRLCDIRFDHLKAYQRLRADGGEPFLHRKHKNAPLLPSPVKPAQINQELSMVVRILKRANLWVDSFELYFEELQEDQSEIPRALSCEEERRWLDVSYSNHRWWLVHWYSTLAFATCMGTNELRSLRLGDINLPSRVLTVPVEGAKTKYRHRTIPLRSPQVIWAVENLIKRAAGLGSCQPDHYLFPFRDRQLSEYIPFKPMTRTGLRTLWDEVRQAAGLMKFRAYDMRHTAVTRLAEAGVPLSVIMEFAGHISPEMTRHYTHISDQGKIQAMEQAQRFRNPQRSERQMLPEHHSPLSIPSTWESSNARSSPGPFQPTCDPQAAAPILFAHALPSVHPAQAIVQQDIQAEIARQISALLKAYQSQTSPLGQCQVRLP